ncbi:ABC superfamily ATP binding cassette transporter, binding domain protein [Mycobacterium xenopi 4042]|uniref:ABC superfamily ATP binding cassette transporter, binding domain protein n=1 Tax=Mycobacterium xenopi 4042 TaxID=1299334 RepID=X8ANJ1_MYCXE|nr:ABC superfamily ATP binding cassette transporter, binding domain protein [Mycobacterium xenopi 4042]
MLTWPRSRAVFPVSTPPATPATPISPTSIASRARRRRACRLPGPQRRRLCPTVHRDLADALACHRR